MNVKQELIKIRASTKSNAIMRTCVTDNVQKCVNKSVQNTLESAIRACVKRISTPVFVTHRERSSIGNVFSPLAIARVPRSIYDKSSFLKHENVITAGETDIRCDS